MAGVGLVGFSGSLIKDTIKESSLPASIKYITGSLSDLPPPEPIDKPEATTVLVGKSFEPTYVTEDP